MDEHPQLGALLVRKGLLSPEQLEAALARQKISNRRLGEELVRSGVLPERAVLQSLAESLRMPFVTIAAYQIDPRMLETIPARIVTHYNFVPLREHDGKLEIAISDPLDLHTLDEIRLLLKRPLQVMLASADEIAETIKKFYGVGAKTMAQMVEGTPHLQVLSQSGREAAAVALEATDDPSVIKFLDQIIQQAVRERATDIHIEPYEEAVRLRYRIDGILYDVPMPPTIYHFQSAIIVRIKIMADLDIAEKRLPQDGRIKVRIDNEDYDLRISIMPTSFGESVGIRILSRRQVFFDLDQLGVDPAGVAILNKMIRRPHGILLVTGPTGSGKTTTLYSCLNRINSQERKIITIEDPIEYQLYGITQIQVNPKIELTFANGLRSMLRHDPDIMMVGEIRDLETAELSIRTALTGHLVFSTLHTNDAAGAVTRLLDMGIEPYLVSSSLNCVIAQRLVRTVCQTCREEFTPDAEIIRELDPDASLSQVSHFYRGKGCDQCKFTGYQGRTAIFEMLDITDAIRDMILKRTPSNTIKQNAVTSQEMNTLRQAGLAKIIRGITTPEEVLRVTQDDAE